MPSFICHLRLVPCFQNPENWTTHTNALIAAHFSYLNTLFKQGTISMVGKTELEISDANNFGIYLFNTEDEESAKLLASSDPVVVAGVMHAVVFPFRKVL